METSWIQDQSQFHSLCDQIRSEGRVAFDTEFISEGTYRPELCLLQFATPSWVAAVDPFEVRDLSRWWEIMTDGSAEVIVHGGREEVRFCMTERGRPSDRLVDVQIAEGLRGRSFPLGYEALVKRVLGVSVDGRETRTDWRRRPLTPSQIEYSLEDVRHLISIWDKQKSSLVSMGRASWARAEFQRMIDEVANEKGPDSWQRLPGITRLSRRELAVVRELHAWREREASEKDRPPRRVLRDDLVVELARRRPKTTSDFSATRDLQRQEYKKYAAAIVDVIAQTLKLPESEFPPRMDTRNDDASHDEQVIGQFLSLALANRCADMNIAQILVGSMSDLREFVRWMSDGQPPDVAPRLTQSWRAEVCGDLLADVFAGRISIRVADPTSDHPLVFERRVENPVVDTHRRNVSPATKK